MQDLVPASNMQAAIKSYITDKLVELKWWN